jgi:hypothetical protein
MNCHPDGRQVDCIRYWCGAAAEVWPAEGSSHGLCGPHDFEIRFAAEHPDPDPEPARPRRPLVWRKERVSAYREAAVRLKLVVCDLLEKMYELRTYAQTMRRYADDFMDERNALRDELAAANKLIRQARDLAELDNPGSFFLLNAYVRELAEAQAKAAGIVREENESDQQLGARALAVFETCGVMGVLPFVVVGEEEAP